MNVYESARTPVELAGQFASYIRNPSTLRARVKDHFGMAPSLERCAAIIAEKQKRPRAHYSLRARANLFDNFDCDCDRTDDNIYLAENGEAYCKHCKAAKEAPKVVVAITPPKKPARLFPNWYNPQLAARPRLHTETLKAVADAFLISVGELIGDNRSRQYVNARAVAVQVFRRQGLSYPHIKRILNRKCHSTIIHLWDTWPERSRQFPELVQAYERVAR